MNWIAVATKSKAEFIAQMHLSQQGYEVYLPLCVTGDDVEAKPFFPSYLFVDTDPKDGQWRPIVSTRGVVRVLMTGDHPSVVPGKVIELMRRREEAGVIRLKRKTAAQTFKPGERVKLHEGPFNGFEGVFERAAGKDRVMLLIDMFGRIMPIEAAMTDVASAA